VFVALENGVEDQLCLRGRRVGNRSLRNLTAAAAGASSRSETESCHLFSVVAFPPGNTSAVLYSSEI